MSNGSPARHGVQVALFGVSTALNGAISLVAIPIITGIAGAVHWASMATGQAIGSSFAVVVIFGWGLTGPATVAMTPIAARAGLFLDSLTARIALLVPVLLVQALVTVAIVPHQKLVAYVAGVAMTLAGASANWFFVGEGRAGRFLLLDTVPRVTGTLVGAGLLALTGDLLPFAIAQLAGSMVALVASATVILRGGRLDYRAAASAARVISTLRGQRHGIVATGITAAFTPAVLAIVAVVVPVILPAFVLADRLARFAGMAVSPLLQMFQGWVPASAGDERVRRTRLAGAATAAIAVSTGAGYAIVLAPAADLLTHGQIEFSFATAAAFAIVTTMYISAAFVGTVALMAGRVRLVARSAVVGVPATLLVVLMVTGSGVPEPAAWAVAAGNLGMIVVPLVMLRAAFRHGAPSGTQPESERPATFATVSGSPG